jgi:hypothetical protein
MVQALHLRLERFAHQHVVDAQAAVLLVAQHPVVPPAVAFLGLLEQAEAVAQSQAEQLLEMVALLASCGEWFRFRPSGSKLSRSSGVMLKSPSSTSRGALQLVADEVAQAVQPLHLVGELVAAWRLAVHEIAVDHAQVATRGIWTVAVITRDCSSAKRAMFLATTRTIGARLRMATPL